MKVINYVCNLAKNKFAILISTIPACCVCSLHCFEMIRLHIKSYKLSSAPALTGTPSPSSLLHESASVPLPGFCDTSGCDAGYRRASGEKKQKVSSIIQTFSQRVCSKTNIWNAVLKLKAIKVSRSVSLSI